MSDLYSFISDNLMYGYMPKLAGIGIGVTLVLAAAVAAGAIDSSTAMPWFLLAISPAIIMISSFLSYLLIMETTNRLCELVKEEEAATAASSFFLA